MLYPVGLVTAQDVVLAGGYFNDSTDLYKGGAAGFKNKKYYMYNTDNKYWTMTAADTSHPIYVDENGTLKYGEYSSAEYDIIPVISLKANVFVESGNGSSTSPYIVK